MRILLLSLGMLGLFSLQTIADPPGRGDVRKDRRDDKKDDRKDDRRDDIKQAIDDTHMAKALAALQEARVHLEAAKHVYGGHRAKALDNTKEAIEEMQKAKRHIAKEIKEEIRDKKKN